MIATSCHVKSRPGLLRSRVRKFRAGVAAVAFCICICICMGDARAATQATLIAVRDTPIFGPDNGSAGVDFTTHSNGAGYTLFAGTNGTGSTRRSLLQFDFSTLPPGAVVTSATLNLTLDREPNANNQSMSLHRVTTAWTTGTSNSDTAGTPGQGAPATTNDATWIFCSYPTLLWQNPGGDFLADTIASAWVGPLGPNSTPLTYSWSSQGMVDSINAWIQDPTTNFGWILIGNESQTQSVKRFISAEAVASDGSPMDASLLPNLVITYEISSDASAVSASGDDSGAAAAATASPWGKLRRRALLSRPAGF